MDNYLIYLVQSYNREALNILIEKYRKSVVVWAMEIIGARNLYKHCDFGVLKSDVEIVLYKAIETYDSSKGIFYTYLKGAVHNIVMNYIRSSRKNFVVTMSLEDEIDEDIILLDSLSSDDNLSKIEERFYGIDEFKELQEKMGLLKKEEQDILYLKMLGYSYQEISDMTKTNIRSINYLIKKVKKL